MYVGVSPHVTTYKSTNTHTVPDLPVCVGQRAVAQCCSTQYIQDRLSITEDTFLEGLRIELRERFQPFEALADELRACK